jgi:hypothetical protein
MVMPVLLLLFHCTEQEKKICCIRYNQFATIAVLAPACITLMVMLVLLLLFHCTEQEKK